MLRIGVIGTGRMGKPRIDNVRRLENAELAWVCSREPERARDLIGRTPESAPGFDEPVEIVADWREALDRGDVDAVMVCSPNALHAPMVEAALEAGAHVLVEYPDTTSVADSRRLQDFAREQSLVYHVGLTHHCHPGHRYLKELLNAGPTSGIGLPRSYTVVSCSGNPISRWFDRDALSGGMFIASFYHLVDEALELIGPAQEVRGHYQAERDADGLIRRDCGHLTIRFRIGCVGQFSYARGFPPPGVGHRRTIICEEGYVLTGDGLIRVLTPDGEEIIEPPADDPVLADTRQFVDFALGEDEGDPTGPASLDTLSVLEEALASLEK